MKTKLSYEFDSEADDPDNIKTIADAIPFKYAIDNFDEWLRGKIKYGRDPVAAWPAVKSHNDIPDYSEAVASHIFEICRDKLRDFIEGA